MADNSDNPAPLVVGIVPGQPDHVLGTALDYARGLGGEIICVYVDVTRFASEFLPNGLMVPMIDPDVADERPYFPPELAEQVERVLSDSGIEYSTHAVSGDPAESLSAVAESVGARSIIVGTRERGFLASIEELVNGSVAARLAHRQARPVVVVPLAPSTKKKVAGDELNDKALKADEAGDDGSQGPEQTDAGARA